MITHNDPPNPTLSLQTLKNARNKEEASLYDTRAKLAELKVDEEILVARLADINIAINVLCDLYEKGKKK